MLCCMYILEFCVYIESMLEFHACILYLSYILSLETFLYHYGSILVTFCD